MITGRACLAPPPAGACPPAKPCPASPRLRMAGSSAPPISGRCCDTALTCRVIHTARHAPRPDTGLVRGIGPLAASTGRCRHFSDQCGLHLAPACSLFGVLYAGSAAGFFCIPPSALAPPFTLPATRQAHSAKPPGQPAQPQRPLTQFPIPLSNQLRHRRDERCPGDDRVQGPLFLQ